VRQVASALACSTLTVYRLVHKGALRSVRIANGVRVHPAELEAFVSRDPTAEAPTTQPAERRQAASSPLDSSS
jgi:excisionase family DNA binding protein